MKPFFPPTTSPFRRNLIRLSLLGILVVGFALRATRYAFRGPLWVDEAMISLNILDRDYPTLLFTALKFDQAAPPGYLLLTKLSTSLLGPSEYALRSLPLLAGMALLFISPLVCLRFLSPPATLLAVLWISLNGSLIYYSAEVKPYAMDALASLIIFTSLTHPRALHSTTFLLCLFAVVALPWFSFPATFCVTGCLGALLFTHLIPQDRPDARRPLRFLVLIAAFLASFLLEYSCNC